MVQDSRGGKCGVRGETGKGKWGVPNVGMIVSPGYGICYLGNLKSGPRPFFDFTGQGFPCFPIHQNSGDIAKVGDSA